MLLALVAFAQLADNLAPAQAASERRCASAGSETVVRNAAARVFERRGRFYLCDRRTGRKRFIGPRAKDLDNERLNRFRLAGGMLAYERFYGAFRSDPSYEIYVRDVASGRVTRRIEGAPIQAPRQEPQAKDGIRDLVVNRNGDVGWIVQNPYTSGPRLEVRKSDSGGDALLDSGDGISSTSLTLEDDVLRWRNAGEAKSAPLD